MGQSVKEQEYLANLFKEVEGLTARGEFEEALLKINTAEINVLNTFGSKSLVYGNLMFKKASVFIDQYQPDTSIQLLNKSKEILEVVLGKNHPDLSYIYLNLSKCYSIKGSYEGCIENAQNALSILKKYNDKDSIIAAALTNLGNCYESLGEYSLSLDSYNKALKIIESISGSESIDVAGIMLGLGTAYHSMGEYLRALETYNKILILLNKIKTIESPLAADVYNNMGNTLNYLGRYKEGAKYHEQSLALCLKFYGKEHPYVADSYNNLGVSYAGELDFEKAINYFKKGLEIRINAYGETHPLVVNSLMNIANQVDKMGEPEKAIEYLKKGLDILHEIFTDENHIEIIMLLTNTGTVYIEMKKYDEALKCFEKANKITSSILDSLNIYDYYNYQGIAGVHFNKKNYDNALENYKIAYANAAFVFGEKSQFAAQTLNNIAYSFIKKGDMDSAEVFYQKAFFANNYKKGNYASVLSNEELLRTVQQLGDAYNRKGDYRYYFEALNLFKDAYGLTRQVLHSFTDAESKQIFTENAKDMYEGGILSSTRLFEKDKDRQYLNDAFTASEESRSLSLYESLRESDALHFAGIPDSLLQREYDLRVDIAYYDKKRFEEEIEKKKPITDSTLLAINSTLFDLKRAYEDMKDTFELRYPDYYRLKYDLQVESVENVQQSLPPDQALLEYFVGDSSIFIFLVKKNDYRAIEVKKDFPLEDWVKQLRHGIYGYHTADPNLKTDDLRDSCASEYIESATALYQKLLAPVDSLLPRRVVIVPDGALGYIPFEALLTDRPKRANRFHEYPYFGGQTGKEHSISYCYSATLLREMTTRQHRQTPGKSFLAYAPYYDGDTTLLASRSIDPNNPANRLPPLKYATEEVEALHDIMGGKAVIGRSARKDSLIQEAGQYRIVHLSTHGKANDKVGDYSFLAFSEVKDSVDNEWLYVRDIYNLSLNADMVVLSACETGIGELKRGEGIISLARAFAYAGAKSIVTTLWSVDDAKTKDLMLFFYRHLKQGMTKDEALAKARSDYFEKYKSGDAHPYFWAGFIGIGDMGAVK